MGLEARPCGNSVLQSPQLHVSSVPVALAPQTALAFSPQVLERTWANMQSTLHIQLGAVSLSNLALGCKGQEGQGITVPRGVSAAASLLGSIYYSPGPHHS